MTRNGDFQVRVRWARSTIVIHRAVLSRVGTACQRGLGLERDRFHDNCEECWKSPGVGRRLVHILEPGLGLLARISEVAGIET